MSRGTIQVDDALATYIYDVSLREPEIFRKLREETSRLPQAGMQIGPIQGQFMALLVELIGARKTLEIGTFTGYSAMWTASALPEDGKLIACDRSEEWTSIARRYWKQAGLAHKIELRLGAALETLDQLIEDGAQESFDFAFIDADKENYVHYYERVLTLLRPGALLAVDNVLWSGRVIDDQDQEESTRAIRAFNETLRADTRVHLSLLPIGDGVTLARKLG